MCVYSEKEVKTIPVHEDSLDNIVHIFLSTAVNVEQWER